MEDKIKEAIGVMEKLIHSTPSGHVRNRLTDVNIILHHLQSLSAPLEVQDKELNRKECNEHDFRAFLFEDNKGKEQRIIACIDCGVHAFLEVQDKESQNDAVAFVEWIGKKKYIKGRDLPDYWFDEDVEGIGTTEELYNIYKLKK